MEQFLGISCYMTCRERRNCAAPLGAGCQGHLPPGSLTDRAVESLLAFPWEAQLPWDREPGGSAAPQPFGSSLPDGEELLCGF